MGPLFALKVCSINRQSNLTQATYLKAQFLPRARKLRRDPTARCYPVPREEALALGAELVGNPSHRRQRVPHHISAVPLSYGFAVDIGCGCGLP